MGRRRFSPGASNSEGAQVRAVESAQELGLRLNSRGALRGRDDAACSELTGIIQALQANIASCGGPAAAPPAANESLEAGRAAVLRFYERPARCRRARLWLRRHGLGHLSRLLDEVNLLVYLEDLASTPALADGLDIPPRGLGVLGAAGADGRLVPEDLAPGPLPPGWEKRKSGSTGLRYFFKKEGQVTQWERPTIASLRGDDTEDQLALPEPPPLELQLLSPLGGGGSGATGEAGYIIPLDKGRSQCLICAELASPSHRESAGHARAVERWQALARRSEAELQVLARAAPSSPLQDAWRHELHLAIFGRDGLAKRGREELQVETAFWHRVVRPRLDRP